MKNIRFKWLVVGCIAACCSCLDVCAQNKETFTVPGYTNTAFVIMPARWARGVPIPWVWYAPTFTGYYPGVYEDWMFDQFLARGIAIAGVDIGESYGSPDGRAVYSALYQELTGNRGMASKPCMLVRSRGGLMLYNWACDNPSSVACVAGIYPVCDLESYPGLAIASPGYHMTKEELAASLSDHNPIDRIGALIPYDVPIFHIHGDSDTVVPLEENSAELARRYNAMGGRMTVEVAPGEGHSYWEGFFHSQTLVDLIIEGAGSPPDQSNWYVTTNGTGTGTSWADAMNSIQGAIDASNVGDTIWVSNGVYNTGGVTNYPAGSSLLNRVAITKAVTVRSANNDPANTVIQGAWDGDSQETAMGPAAARCVYLANGASLIGFTLTQGATRATGKADDQAGGGVYCWNSTSPAISNCVISGNAANLYGGGVFYGTLRSCMIASNYSGQGGGARSSYLYSCTVSSNRVKSGAVGGGAYAGYLENCAVSGNSATDGAGVHTATITNCTLIGNTAADEGGGAMSCMLYNCMIVSNTAASRGGGIMDGNLYNCSLIGNHAVGYAGGAMSGTLNNCTIVSNSSDGHTGGARFSRLNNCILYFNTAPSYPNFFPSDLTITFTNSCTTPAMTGWATGNITNNPMFVQGSSGNYRLGVSSPCIDAGLYAGWMDAAIDLDGKARIHGAAVDIGAYEFVPSYGMIFIIH